MRNKGFVLVASYIIMLCGLSFLFCIPFAIYYNDPSWPFYIPSLLLSAMGILLYSISNKSRPTIKSNSERVALVILTWTILLLAGMLPYLFSEVIPSWVNTFFETVSGLTTTGSTILENPELLPKSLLLWRSLTHWIGGLTTIILLFTILPPLNIGGSDLFLSMGKTPVKASRLIVRIIQIYCVLTSLQVILLHLGGMNLFESLCHSFGMVSSGAFSPKDNSIAGYSTTIQLIMALFMFLSGFSYVIYFLAINGKFKKAIAWEENRIYVVLVALFTLLIAGILFFKDGGELGVTFVESVFQVTSMASSSGYYTIDYSGWPNHVLPLIYLLIIVGGSTGSASGGIKMSRFLILLKNLSQQFKVSDMSENTVAIKYNGRKVNENNNLSVLTYITVFGFLFVLGTILLSMFGNELEKCVFLALSALSNFGVNVTIADFSSAEKIIMSLLMILGRLEIYPLLLLFVPLFYKTADHNTEKTSE
jgi:trk system potassium uptake protein